MVKGLKISNEGINMHLRTLPKIMLALLAFIFSSAAFAQASDEVKNLLLASDKTGEMKMQRYARIF